MARHAIQQLRFNNTLYPGIAGWQFDPGTDINSDALDSTVHETAHHGMASAPTFDLSTRDLGFLSVLADSTDVWLKACDTTNGIEAIGGKAATDGPGWASSTVHLVRKAARGVLLGTGITWSKGGKAELALRGMGISADGTTAAISTSTIALPTQPTPDMGWKLSALTLNNTSISAVDSLEISVDPRASFDYLAGLPEPTGILMAGVNGPAMWRMSAAIGDCESGSGTAAVSSVFKKLATGGGFSGAANSTLTITFNSLWSIEQSVGGQSGTPMSRSLLVLPRYNGSTKPVTWAFS